MAYASDLAVHPLFWMYLHKNWFYTHTTFILKRITRQQNLNASKQNLSDIMKTHYISLQQ